MLTAADRDRDGASEGKQSMAGTHARNLPRNCALDAHNGDLRGILFGGFLSGICEILKMR